MSHNEGPSNRGNVWKLYQTTRAALGLSGIAGDMTVSPREEPYFGDDDHNGVDDLAPVDREGSPAHGNQLRRTAPRPRDVGREPRLDHTCEAGYDRHPAPALEMLHLMAMVRQIMCQNPDLINDDLGAHQSHTPFTDDILHAKYPQRFTIPTIPPYSGKSDPSQHIMKYKWHMDCARTCDAIKCRCFPITLEGVATMWFTKLPPRSISSFDQLA